MNLAPGRLLLALFSGVEFCVKVLGNLELRVRSWLWVRNTRLDEVLRLLSNTSSHS